MGRALWGTVVILFVAVCWLASELHAALRDGRARRELAVRRTEAAAHTQLMITRARMRRTQRPIASARHNTHENETARDAGALGRRFGDPRWFNDPSLN